MHPNGTRDLGASWCEEALINEGGRDQDDGHAHESADPVKLIEIIQVVQEKFGQRDAEEGDSGITRAALLDPHADDDEAEREERPHDRVSHVAGEVAREGKGEGRANREIIRDLDVEEEENENHA